MILTSLLCVMLIGLIFIPFIEFEQNSKAQNNTSNLRILSSETNIDLPEFSDTKCKLEESN